MCGIFGYVGKKRNAAEAVLEGLRRLDYRGYDSWGVGVVSDAEISVDKNVGVVTQNMSTLPKSSVGIGHTRWATHGAVTVDNAHPHFATDRSFVLGHNGIAENAAVMKKTLVAKGYSFISETDTEVIVRMIEEEQKKKVLFSEALRMAVKKLIGRNTVIALTKGGEIVAARNGSPLVVGISDSKEIYLSSDVLSFSPHVQKVLVLDNGQMVESLGATIVLRDVKSGKELKPRFEKNTLKGGSVDKGGFEHYMLKEVHEEPAVIRELLKQSDKELNALARAIRKARTVYCIGSGTAGAAAAQMSYYLREYGKIPAVALIGAEAQEYRALIGARDLFIAPSQSGETADVLEVLEEADRKGASIASFVNMPGSMITRMSDFKFMANAGAEVCVMSTKIFVSQIAWGYLVSKAVQGRLSEGKRNLNALATQIEKYLKQSTREIEALAAELCKKQHVFLLGKGQNLQMIKEGMVKIIEGSYVHAHAMPAGDLKHYAITLMQPGVNVIAALSKDTVKSDVLNAIHEVKARGARCIGIASENAEEFDSWLQVPDTKETSAIMNILPLQLLAYYMAVELGNNVDKPRNIAKSVTVK